MVTLAYNRKTYGSQDTFRRFVESNYDLRHVWVGKNHRTKKVGHDAFFGICGLRCANPRCNSELDYSLGFNIKDGKKAADNTPSLDHIVPTTKGGADELDNWQVLCNRCNTAKNAMYGAEDAERLRGLADMIDKR